MSSEENSETKTDEKPAMDPLKMYLSSDIIVLSFVVGTEFWVILKCFFDYVCNVKFLLADSIDQ